MGHDGEDGKKSEKRGRGGERSRRRRWIWLVSALVAVLLLGGAGLYQLADSRTFQLAGELISHVETDEKVVALTFDDGPDQHTGEIVGVLAKEGVHTTFFVIGSQVRSHPEYAAALVVAGHQLGNHTYNHRRMVFVSQGTVAAEIEQTDALIREAGQKGDIPFRPPNGKKFLGCPSISPSMIGALSHGTWSPTRAALRRPPRSSPRCARRCVPALSSCSTPGTPADRAHERPSGGHRGPPGRGLPVRHGQRADRSVAVRHGHDEELDVTATAQDVGKNRRGLLLMKEDASGTVRGLAERVSPAMVPSHGCQHI
ncbi:polysaccharide deacetylase family protein [Streptosporangium sp. NPDC051022]|uniref:polysaccharide deacetylase family protein n=1 Tax=Streptosporangium sp. NPDC051022 TaxID=3155752 RepID=UPI00342BF4F5